MKECKRDGKRGEIGGKRNLFERLFSKVGHVGWSDNGAVLFALIGTPSLYGWMSAGSRP